jgi:protein-disulfide isomerase
MGRVVALPKMEVSVSDTAKRPIGIWIAVAIAALAAGFGYGFLSNRAPKDLGGPLTDGRRYAVPVSLTQPRRGPREALVTLVEWCDLQGEACEKSEAVTAELLRKFDGRLRHVWRHLADKKSEGSLVRHEFARLALEQSGKFWEVQKLLLGRDDKAPTAAELEGYARQLGLDWAAIERELKKQNYRAYVRSDGIFAERFGVTEGPTYYVNGRRLSAPATKERLETLIERELAQVQKVVAGGVALDKLYAHLTSKGLFAPPLPIVAKAP